MFFEVRGFCPEDQLINTTQWQKPILTIKSFNKNCGTKRVGGFETSVAWGSRFSMCSRKRKRKHNFFTFSFSYFFVAPCKWIMEAHSFFFSFANEFFHGHRWRL